jgi:predicted Zn finger-like uncharacterized protein
MGGIVADLPLMSSAGRCAQGPPAACPAGFRPVLLFGSIMELSCPQCDTHFNIADEALGPAGRKVRCSVCSHVWHAMPAAEDDVLSLEPAPASATPTAMATDRTQAYADSPPGGTGEAPPPAPARDLPPLPIGDIPRWDRPEAATAAPETPATVPAAPRRRGPGVVIGLALLAAVAASYLFRDAIVTAVPVAKRVFQLAELPLQQVGDGLEFINLSSGPVTENGQPMLRVTGFIQNRRDFRSQLPWVLIEVVDSENTVVASATRPPPQPGTIDPQGAVRIVYDLPQPDRAVEGLNIAMRFVEGSHN